MNAESIHPVILCGGSGTRLWPRSRPYRPKPFLPLLGQRTLFQQTLDRCGDPAQFAAPIIVAGEAHRDHIAAQADMAGGTRLIVEPAAKNTAPAIALAALALPPDVVMLVCPSDHHIADMSAFREAAAAAAKLAQEGWLVAFGIAADRPETGYGYLKQGESLPGGAKVERFVEKPDAQRAQGFLDEGGYAWNGGLFAFRAGTFLDELRTHRPDMAAAAEQAMENAAVDGATIRPAAEPFAAIAGESVDYAVMENTARAAMVPARMGWSDIGNWQALHDADAHDDAGNAVRGRAELVNCANVRVETDGPRVSVIGLTDVVIVVDGDEVLVTHADGAQVVGKLAGAKGD